MPELPEVETIVRDLRPGLVGREITGAHVLWPRTVAAPDLPLFTALLAGQRITTVSRRGKFLVLSLDSGDALLIHLRMTGHLEIEPAEGDAPAAPYTRAWFDLSGRARLVFSDQRKFGRLWLAENAAVVTAQLGPEPLTADFTPEGLAQALAKRRVAIKTVLLDQRVLAGVGNIYANEALFLARIHPARPADSLSGEEIRRLHEAIRTVLDQAIAECGTTLRNYYRPGGASGNYQEQRRVHDRKDQPCPECGAPVERMVIGQRSAYYCPHCQPRP